MGIDPPVSRYEKLVPECDECGQIIYDGQWVTLRRCACTVCFSCIRLNKQDITDLED